MKKTFFALLAATAAIIACKPAQSNAQEGFYVGGLGAANFIEVNRNHHHNNNRRFQTGYAVGGFAGYEWCEGFRLEAEATYRSNQRKKHHHSDVSSSEFRHNGGRFHSWSVMANALYDIDLSTCGCYGWDIVPYVGAGIGYTNQKAKRHHHDESSSSSEVVRHHHKNDKNGFAWQLIVGLSYPVACNTDIAIDYRFHKGSIKRLYDHTVGGVIRYHF